MPLRGYAVGWTWGRAVPVVPVSLDPLGFGVSRSFGRAASRAPALAEPRCQPAHDLPRALHVLVPARLRADLLCSMAVSRRFPKAHAS